MLRSFLHLFSTIGLALALVVAPLTMDTVAQTTDTLMFESFEAGEFPAGWTIVDNNNDANTWDITTAEPRSGDYSAEISYTTDGNDDWIISPPIDLTQLSSVEFSFWASAFSSSWPEDFNVKVSTSSADVADFTTTLEEVLDFDSDTYQQFAYDLSDYSGQTIYLAIQNVSVDQFYLYIDDVLLRNTASTDPAVAADFTADVTTGTAPLTVTFTDASTGASSWAWDFDGDGTIDNNTDANPSHIYSDAGTYTVVLTVDDGTGTTATQTKVDYITVNESSADVTIYYVATDGSDTSGDGSINNPFATIQHAIDQASDGDKIEVAAGSYTENIDLGAKNLKLYSSSGAESTIINGNDGNHVIAIIGGQTFDTVVEGFTLTNAHDGVYVKGSQATITRNILKGNSYGAYSDINWDTGTGSDLKLSYNLIYENSLDGLQLAEKGTHEVFNNTILWNTQSGVVVYFTSADIRNNIIVLNNEHGISYTSDDSSVLTNDYNIIWANGSNFDNATFGTNDLLVDPKFVDTGNYDFHLRDDSPAIDAGDPDSQYNDPDGTRNDIGAYYYTSSTLTADFNTDVTSGTAPLTVQFSDQSTGTITGWTWDFGDGNSSNDQHPTHTYNSAGTYTVSLEITDGSQTDQTTKTDLITVTEDDQNDGNWEVISDGGSENLEDVFFLDETTGWIAANGIILQTTDAGKTWSDIASEFYYEAQAIHFIDANTGFLVAEIGGYIDPRGAIFKSTDGGVTWTNIYENDNYLWDIEFLDASIGWAVGTNGTIVKTTDGGQNWTDQSSGITQHIRNVEIVDTQTAYAATDGTTEHSGLLKTTDGGSTWNAVAMGNTYDIYEIDFVDHQHGWLSSTAGRVLYTTDAGANWTETNVGESNTLYSISFASTTRGVVVGFGGTIARTDNGGQDWLLDDFTTTRLSSVVTLNTTTAIAIGSDETILRFSEANDTEPLVADFSADVTSGNQPLTVHFTDASSGNITSWSWEFGDGKTSSEQHPSHSYTEAGTFTVKLTVSDGTNSVSETKTDYISVSESIVADPPAERHWKWLNPLPQGNSLWDVDSPDGTTAYAVGSAGTILKSTDGGDSWTLLTTINTEEVLYGVHFLDANTGFVAGENKAVFKTTDGGDTWASIPASYTTYFNTVHFLNSQKGFIAGGSGTIQMTTDGGASWSTVTHPGHNYYLNDIHFLDDQTGFIVGGNSAYDTADILKTTDGGNNWTLIDSPVDNQLTSVYFIDDQIGFIVGYYGTLLKTTDGGDTWTDVAADGIYHTLHDIQFTDAQTGYAMGTYGTIWKTTDQGSSWTKISTQLDHELRAGFFNTSGQGLVVDTHSGIQQSDANGSEWTSIMGTRFQNLNTVDFYNQQYGFAAGAEGMLLRTTDGGETLAEVTSTSNTIYDLHIVSRTVILAAADDGDLLKSTNAGHHWVEIGPQATMAYRAIFGVTDEIYYASGYNGEIVKTEDGGANWTTLNSTYNARLNDLYFFNADEGIAIGGVYAESKILKTTDGGANWTSITAPVDKELTTISFVDATTGYISGSDGTILQTTDGGDTWTDVFSTSSYDDFNGIDVLDANHIMVAGDRGVHYVTEDGGDNWTKGQKATGSYIQDISYPAEGIGYAVSWYGAFLQYNPDDKEVVSLFADFTSDTTQSDTQTAISFTDHSQGNVSSWSWDFGDGSTSSDQHPTHTYASAGTYTVTLTVSDGNSSDAMTYTDHITVEQGTALTTDQELPTRVELKPNYPNPFNPATMITYGVPQTSDVSLMIYDILGRRLQTLVNQRQAAGWYSVRFNAEHLPSGVYIYRLKAGNTVHTLKMVLVK
ncbi:MAG: YCF48-related protein [Bacteroidota bacterium]